MSQLKFCAKHVYQENNKDNMRENVCIPPKQLISIMDKKNLELSNKKVRKSAFEMGQGFEYTFLWTELCKWLRCIFKATQQNLLLWNLTLQDDLGIRGC